MIYVDENLSKGGKNLKTRFTVLKNLQKCLIWILNIGAKKWHNLVFCFFYRWNSTIWTSTCGGTKTSRCSYRIWNAWRNWKVRISFKSSSITLVWRVNKTLFIFLKSKNTLLLPTSYRVSQQVPNNSRNTKKFMKLCLHYQQCKSHFNLTIFFIFSYFVILRYFSFFVIDEFFSYFTRFFVLCDLTIFFNFVGTPGNVIYHNKSSATER